nr:porin family protein [uncultured Glaciecola sp.]
MKRKFLLLAALAMTSSATLAGTPAFNFIEAGYGTADIDDVDEVSPSGFAIGGSFLVGESVFVTASYASLGDDVFGTDIDLVTSSIGLGYRLSLTDSTDAYASVSYEYVEADIEGFGSEDDNGYGLTVGFRSRLTEQFELDGSIGYVDIADESETAVGISGHYYFTPNFAVGLSYSTTADISITGVSARYAF